MITPALPGMILPLNSLAKSKPWTLPGVSPKQKQNEENLFTAFGSKMNTSEFCPEHFRCKGKKNVESHNKEDLII